MQGEEVVLHDWNGGEAAPARSSRAELTDATLREAPRCPSAAHPTIAERIELLHLEHALGLRSIALGAPGPLPRAFNDVLRLAQELAEAKLAPVPSCAARPTYLETRAILDIGQRAGLRVEACLWPQVSAVERFVGLDLPRLLRASKDTITFAVRERLDVTYAIEDAARAPPELLEALLRCALEHGTKRVLLCDSTGAAGSAGVRRLFAWTRDLVSRSGGSASVDWCGHNDRGLALSNALAAIGCGADRVYASCLGLGERAGPAPLELLFTERAASLASYCRAVARAYRRPIPENHPIFGADVFRASTAAEAAAAARSELAYSAVSASRFGRTLDVEIGPESGPANVVSWLRRRRFEPNEALVALLLDRARSAARVLEEQEVVELIGRTS